MHRHCKNCGEHIDGNARFCSLECKEGFGTACEDCGKAESRCVCRDDFMLDMNPEELNA